jgi:alanine racemase
LTSSSVISPDKEVHYGPVVEVDLPTLAENLRQVRRLVSPASVLAVIKGDAYGHGAYQTARCFLSAGATMLGVSFTHEGILLRSRGITAPILILTGVPLVLAAEAVSHDLTPVVYEARSIGALEEAASSVDRCIRVHLKIDTGLGRIGVKPKHAEGLLRVIADCHHLQLEGILTHLASAYEPSNARTEQQLSVFKKLLGYLHSKGWNIPLVHCANSGGIVNYPESHFNMVRPGTMLYTSLITRGIGPDLGLRPAMTLKARLLDVKRVRSGTHLGYEGGFIAQQDTVVGLVPVGYANGYSRLMSGNIHALVRRKRVPVIGYIGMNLLQVDLTAANQAGPGDEVTLLGSQGEVTIHPSEVAEAIGIETSELLCSVGRGAVRIYRE